MYKGLFGAFETLRAGPTRCALAPETDSLDSEIRQLLYGRYRILFTISKEMVVILRVRHTARRQLEHIDE
ncbi:MAG: type II toxin-antitoxin system RelE/ParE family toxin [Acidobacteria bacterium]|nr:type II toxin-antitoxin system RelE/ParE family toxin [Acidobacteriota bacterium]